MNTRSKNETETETETTGQQPGSGHRYLRSSFLEQVLRIICICKENFKFCSCASTVSVLCVSAARKWGESKSLHFSDDGNKSEHRFLLKNYRNAGNKYRYINYPYSVLNESVFVFFFLDRFLISLFSSHQQPVIFSNIRIFSGIKFRDRNNCDC